MCVCARACLWEKCDHGCHLAGVCRRATKWNRNRLCLGGDWWSNAHVSESVHSWLVNIWLTNNGFGSGDTHTLNVRTKTHSKSSCLNMWCNQRSDQELWGCNMLISLSLSLVWEGIDQDKWLHVSLYSLLIQSILHSVFFLLWLCMWAHVCMTFLFTSDFFLSFLLLFSH